jgi:Cofilin/tropomyosin-type actin-binding protein
VWNNTDTVADSVQVAPECITKFNELKLGKSIKYIIFKLSDDNKEIVVEDTSDNKDWDEFRNKLVNAKSKNKMGKESKGPRYAVYDFEYDLASGEGSR